MGHFYEHNISEIRNEYTSFLINILTPFIYEALRSFYQYAIESNQRMIESGKNDPNIKILGVTKLFQIALKEIPSLNNHALEVETDRIRSGCKCADWFDDLIRAVIKSNIILLVFTNSKNVSDILAEDFHNKFEIKDFIHKCLISSAVYMYNNPHLFDHKLHSTEIKKNQMIIYDFIADGIKEAIRKTLPMKVILKEYLTNNILDDQQQFNKVQQMVHVDMRGGAENYENTTSESQHYSDSHDESSSHRDHQEESEELQDYTAEGEVLSETEQDNYYADDVQDEDEEEAQRMFEEFKQNMERANEENNELEKSPLNESQEIPLKKSQEFVPITKLQKNTIIKDEIPNEQIEKQNNITEMEEEEVKKLMGVIDNNHKEQSGGNIVVKLDNEKPLSKKDKEAYAKLMEPVAKDKMKSFFEAYMK